MKPFRVSVGLRQGCSLSPIPALNYMDRIVKKTDSCGGVKIVDCTAQRLLFAGDLVPLEDTCSVAEMKISTTKTETMFLSGQPKQCSLQVGEIPLKQLEKFKYCSSVSHSQVMADKITNWISAPEKQDCAVMRQLH